MNYMVISKDWYDFVLMNYSICEYGNLDILKDRNPVIEYKAKSYMYNKLLNKYPLIDNQDISEINRNLYNTFICSLK